VLGFIPDLLQTRSDISHGVMPVWNPDAGAGRPLFASAVHAPLFPLTWLAFILPFWASLGWIAAGKLLLSALGTYLFCRELSLRRGPALLAGISFAFSSYYFVWLEHPQTNVWAMLPWMFFAARRICTRASVGSVALLGGAGGLAWLGGHPESAAFLYAATAAYAAFELLAERTRGPRAEDVARRPLGPRWARPLGRRAGLTVAGLALGVGVAAIVAVPLVELLHQSGKTNRGGAGAPFQIGWSVVFPELWGNPSKAFSAGPLDYEERTFYIGALPVLFAFGTFGRRRPREQWFFVVMAAILLATIFNTPVWANAVRHLPGGMVAALGRLFIIVTFAGAVLAAYGLQRWLTAGSPERRQMLLIMALVAVIPVLAWIPRHPDLLSALWTAMGQLPAVHPSQTNEHVIALASVWRWVVICGIGLGGLALVGRRRSGSLAVALVVLLTGADLVALDLGFHGSIPQSQANPPVPASIRYLQAHQGDGRVTASTSALPANLGERYGLHDPRVGVDIPFPLRYKLLWTGLGQIGGDQEFFVSGTADAHKVADLFGVRYVLLPLGEPMPPWLQPVYKDAGGAIGYNPTALPRAWVAYDWHDSSGRLAALSATVDSTTFAALRRPVIEGAPRPPATSIGAAPPAVTPARVIDDGPNTVTIDAVARRSGYLILDDSAYPGWQASLDGHSVRWLPANENFRAVAIPQGRHVVTFRYRPTSVLGGAIVTLLSILALVAIAVWSALWPSRNRSASGPDAAEAASEHAPVPA
jgi:hypothetical protein